MEQLVSHQKQRRTALLWLSRKGDGAIRRGEVTGSEGSSNPLRDERRSLCNQLPGSSRCFVVDSEYTKGGRRTDLLRGGNIRASPPRTCDSHLVATGRYTRPLSCEPLEVLKISCIAPLSPTAESFAANCAVPSDGAWACTVYPAQGTRYWVLSWTDAPHVVNPMSTSQSFKDDGNVKNQR